MANRRPKVVIEIHILYCKSLYHFIHTTHMYIFMQKMDPVYRILNEEVTWLLHMARLSFY